MELLSTTLTCNSVGTLILTACINSNNTKKTKNGWRNQSAKVIHKDTDQTTVVIATAIMMT